MWVELVVGRTAPEALSGSAFDTVGKRAAMTTISPKTRTGVPIWESGPALTSLSAGASFPAGTLGAVLGIAAIALSIGSARLFLDARARASRGIPTPGTALPPSRYIAHSG